MNKDTKIISCDKYDKKIHGKIIQCIVKNQITNKEVFISYDDYDETRDGKPIKFVVKKNLY